MKIKKILINFAVLLLLSVCCAVGAFAASTAPSLELRETGIKNQYGITLRNWSSEYYGMEFDIQINQNNLDYNMNWSDKQDSSYKKVKSEQTDEKTVLRFYYANRTPVSNSNSAYIGEVSLPNLNTGAKFTTSGKITIADSNAQKIQFNDMNVSVVSSPSNSTDNSNSSDIKEWKDLKEDIKVGTDGVKRITVNLEKNPYIYTDILQELKNDKIIATFQYKDYQWEIDGSSIKTLPQDRIYYDLSVEKLLLKNISATVDKTDILQFTTAFKGDLPFTATLIYPIGTEYAGKTVYVSNYNQQNGTLNYQTDAKIDEKGNLTVSLTNLDNYIVTLKNFWNTSSDKPENTVTENKSTSDPSQSQNESLIVPGIDSEEMQKSEQPQKIENENENKNEVNSASTENTVNSAKNTNMWIYVTVIAVIILLAFIIFRTVIYFKTINKNPK